ncbi:MAG: hypothetical protein O7G85_13145 [Planctomycetota bacterium]|nr:hypothetical protein [Planctomycetota bacterium]
MKRRTTRLEMIMLVFVILLGIDVLSRIPDAANAQGNTNRLLGFTATQTKSGGNTIIWRQWSNGALDKRLFRSSENLSLQGGWVIVQQGN